MTITISRNTGIALISALLSSALLLVSSASGSGRVQPVAEPNPVGYGPVASMQQPPAQYADLLYSVRQTLSTLRADLVDAVSDPDNSASADTEVADSAAGPSMNSEIGCLALNIYFEARGEGTAGQQAVGHVVMNRVASRRFPSTVCDVVRQGGAKRRFRCQFSWWCDGRADVPGDQVSWQRSLQIAADVLNGHCKDPTRGALWYHADFVNPPWRKSFIRTAKIGQHIFYMAA